ncbi:zona pellucida protein C [Parambassis ranga]|uniref:Zona pellucida protein C n=1 Tax=Parambassis ranga TaxID=210632 RepID=A0A6P7HT64_9TELE|nr:uncharacterized protein LOC114427781 [Parambassis ranga]
MGTLQAFLCIFIAHLVAPQSVRKYQDATFSQDYAAFLENVPFPSERRFDLPPYDTIFSSWRTRTPDFHMLSEFPPIMSAPRVQVFCDESKLTLLVDKRAYGFQLTGEDVWLGDGCYRTREVLHQFIFTYGFDQCGTTRDMQNGLEVFTNSIHLNLKPLPVWWKIPPSIQVSCIPKRPYSNPDFFVSTPLMKSKSFSIKAMNPSWSSTADSNVYERGQVINLQISAKTRPDQQLFIQSCFVSASPEPQTRPRQAVIMNKGCTAPVGSSHAAVHFVASNKADVVNVVLNTSYLVSEMYIHCSVLISDLGVTISSKSCNYNLILSRWEELSGDVEVCDCCLSKCKGLSHGAKALVSAGPLVMVDKYSETSPAPAVSEPQEPFNSPEPSSMQSDAPEPAEDMIVIGTSLSRSKNTSPPQHVVTEGQGPAARLMPWLPGQVTELQPSERALNGVPKTEESLKNPATYENEEHGHGAFMRDQHSFTMLDGWLIPPPRDNVAIAEEFQRNTGFGSGRFSTVDLTLPAEFSINYLLLHDEPKSPEPGNAAFAEESQRKKWMPADTDYLNQISNELAQLHMDAALVSEQETANVQPIIRSKVEFSKGADGSQSLSYEEEMKQEGKKTKGLKSTFLYLLR